MSQIDLDNSDSNQSPFPDKSVGEIIEALGQHVPDSIAIVSGEAQYSYAWLNETANQIGWLLKKRGVAVGDVVAVQMSRSVEFVATLVGILKIGAAYLPIDQRWPHERTTFVLECASANILVCNQSNETRCRLSIDLLEINSDVLSKEANDGSSRTSPLANISTDHIAYVNFTSGTSGQPKGVMVPHRGIISLLFNTNYVDFSEKTALLHHSSPSFDAMTFELWGALLHGGKSVLFEGVLPSVSQLRSVISRAQINTVLLTTALFNVVIDSAPEILEPLEKLLTGGEAQSPVHFKKAKQALPKVDVINAYGPTEGSVIATFFRASELSDDEDSVPIGRPISHRTVSLLRPDLSLCEDGEVGEICISGPGVAIGYIGREDLTAEKFVTIDGLGPTYRTGDLGLKRVDGNIEFRGRADNQVKFNGYRIELEEIERTLTRHPKILRSGVVIHGEGIGRKLKAAVVISEKLEADLNNYMSDALPSYMIPSEIIFIDELPINTSGKIDRDGLKALFD